MIYPMPAEIAVQNGIIPPAAPDVLVITDDCIVCGLSSALVLNGEDVKRYQAGALVQEVWPSLSISDREVIVTGAHSACWDTLAGPE